MLGSLVVSKMACATVCFVIHPFSRGIRKDTDAKCIINRVPSDILIILIWWLIVLNAFVQGEQHFLDRIIAFWHMDGVEDTIVSLVDEGMDLLPSGLEQADIQLDIFFFEEEFVQIGIQVIDIGRPGTGIVGCEIHIERKCSTTRKCILVDGGSRKGNGREGELVVIPIIIIEMKFRANDLTAAEVSNLFVFVIVEETCGKRMASGLIGQVPRLVIYSLTLTDACLFADNVDKIIKSLIRQDFDRYAAAFNPFLVLSTDVFDVVLEDGEGWSAISATFACACFVALSTGEWIDNRSWGRITVDAVGSRSLGIVARR